MANMKRFALSINMALFTFLVLSMPGLSTPENTVLVKELNLVFLHGAGGNACAFQLLDDYLTGQLPEYIVDYEKDNPGIEIQVSKLRRCYPGYADIESWAGNIVESINEHFAGKENLVLIGHSMGGKAALYAVARNVGGLADRVAMVTTINSPVKSLNRYSVTGGGSVEQYCGIRWFGTDEGICSSVASYDSSQDGSWVAQNKHWLAFISGEGAPLSDQFNVSGVDAWPRDIDDLIVPLSAQYTGAADVVYYGEYGHSDFSVIDEATAFIGDNILRYIFGDNIERSLFTMGSTFEHRADWLIGTDHWEDIAGEIPASSGKIEHTNESYTRWQEWEDIVGGCRPGSLKGSYYVKRTSLPVLTAVMEAYWLDPDNPAECQLCLRTRAAPRTTVEVEWRVSQRGLLPEGIIRDHYEVEITDGTPLTGIRRVAWLTDDPRDLRLRIWSEAQSPFRWFKADWRVYYKEVQYRKVIDGIPTVTPHSE